MISSSGTVILRLVGGRSNSFLIEPLGKGDILVDTSVRSARQHLMKKLDFHKSSLDYLILTHSHYDHAGNAAYIRRQCKAKVIIHESEASNLENGTMDIPEGTLVATKTLVKLAKAIRFKLSVEPCEVDIKITDNYNLPGYEGIFLIHTPGHSHGSISIVIEDEFAIVGDTLINALLFKVFPPFADDKTALFKSWEKLLYTNCHTFLPSHGKAIKREALIKALALHSKS